LEALFQSAIQVSGSVKPRELKVDMFLQICCQLQQSL
jgi:hypothetical protein